MDIKNIYTSSTRDEGLSMLLESGLAAINIKHMHDDGMMWMDEAVRNSHDRTLSAGMLLTYQSM